MSDSDNVIRTDDAIVVVLDHRHTAAEVGEFVRAFRAANGAPDTWDDDKLAREFEEHFHTYTYARRVEDYMDRGGRALWIIERREPARIGSGPR
jgi:hypothetical protein